MADTNRWHTEIGDGVATITGPDGLEAFKGPFEFAVVRLSQLMNENFILRDAKIIENKRLAFLSESIAQANRTIKIQGRIADALEKLVAAKG